MCPHAAVGDWNSWVFSQRICVQSSAYRSHSNQTTVNMPWMFVESSPHQLIKWIISLPASPEHSTTLVEYFSINSSSVWLTVQPHCAGDISKVQCRSDCSICSVGILQQSREICLQWIHLWCSFSIFLPLPLHSFFFYCFIFLSFFLKNTQQNLYALYTHWMHLFFCEWTSIKVQVIKRIS